MIGDSFEADIEGALNFGIDAIFLTNINIEITSKCLSSKSFLELKNIL